LDQNDIDPIWDELLGYVQAGKVVPIVGAEVMEVEQDGRPLPLYDFIAGKLAARLGLPAEGLLAGATLNDVVCQFFRNCQRREDVFAHIYRIVMEAALQPPELLRKLARIQSFPLYVTLTFDSLLKEAIDQERFGGANRTIERAYSTNEPQDIPAPKNALRDPVVYHLFGKISPMPDCVVTDELILEFLYHIQSASHRPNLLFDELRTNHLLFIGCNFSDWLARFFIRITRARQLSIQGRELTVLADRVAASEPSLVLFLKRFGYGTRIISDSAADFVTELEARYVRLSAAGQDGPPQAASETQMPAGAVFISYAREDFEAACRLRDTLGRRGVEAWFDKRQLEPGDPFDRAIRRAIRESCCFIPLISAASTSRVRGFFQKEWKWAQDEAENFAEGVGFILPVVVDDAPASADSVPEYFRRLHWTRLPGGETTPEFAATALKLQRDSRRRMSR
jgi:hypothetical protein